MHLRTVIMATATLAAIVIGLATSSPLHAAASGPVAAYSFDEGAGATVHDASPQGNDGTTRDTSWSSAGKSGGALAFNGSSSWVTVPDAPSLDLTKGFTLEAWVKPATDLGSAWATILFKEQLNDPVYGLYANSDTASPAGVMSVPSGTAAVRGLAPLPADVWSFVAVSWDGGTLRLFVNGIKVSIHSVSGTLPISSGPLRVGGNGVRGEWFDGLIDDVRIYNQSISGTNIRIDMNTPVAPTAATPPPADVVPPTAPTGLAAANVAPSSITATWVPSTDNVGVVGYDLYQDGLLVGTSTTPVFTFTGLSCGTSYALGVDAFDAAGNISGRQSTTVATLPCPDTSAPSVPPALAAGAIGSDSITVSWTPSTDNVGVAGYTLFRDGVNAGTTSSALFTFAGLACGTSYVLGVDAFDAAGNTSAVSSITAATAPCPDTTPPTPPGGLAAGASTGASIDTSWTASTDNVGVTGYTVLQDGVSVGTTTTTAFTFTGLSCGTGYVLAVQAFDSAGNVSAQTSITSTTAACSDTTAPSAPAGFAAASSTGASIATSWTASTDNVGVAGYSLLVGGAVVGTTTATTFTFAGLSCGTSYALGVEAFDAAGNTSSRQSLTASTTPCPDTIPPQVALTAPADGATVSGTVQLAASASDAGGVASVQFTVDGAAVGAPVATAPYTLGWDSIGATNGPHTLGARATDTSGNTAVSATVTVTVQNAFDTANAFKKVAVGPGFVDAALHSVIRTAAGRVYVFAADDTAERKATGPGVIHAYRADQLGIPTSFTEVDAADRPSATGVTHVVGSPDVRLASDGTAHMVYTDETNATLWYETFSTATDTWGPRVSLATGVDVPLVAIKRETSNALVLDKNDVPHVAYAGGGVVQYRDRVGGSWSAPVTVSSGGTPIHVGLAAAPDGTIDLSWLQGAIAPSSIMFAQRSALGSWSAPETVASGDVLDNANADQGPSVAYSATNEPYVLYVSGKPTSAVRVRHRAGGAWTLDATPVDFFTHTPQIYMQGNDVYAFLGHDAQIRFAYAYRLAGQAWSPLTALTSTIDGTLDGSASIRWDPLHETNAGVIDATFFDEDMFNDKTYFPEAYYMAVLPSGTGGVGTPPGPADTTAPTVSVTAPAAGAAVSGAAVAVSADAADNVGVVGVQFKLDGANLGAEDTAAPYGAVWDSTTTTNGAHTLTAVARDAAGNATTAGSVTVTVSNASAPPPAAGTVLVGNAATESKIDSNAAGQAEAFKANAATSGSVSSLRIFVDAGSAAGSLVVGLYSNNAGHPGTLLTSGTITAPAAGQNNSVPVAAAAVTAGQTYWIAILGRSGVVKFRDRGAVGSGNSEWSLQTTLTSLPVTWSPGTSFTDGLLSAVGLG